jgi:hypothetical protein
MKLFVKKHCASSNQVVWLYDNRQVLLVAKYKKMLQIEANYSETWALALQKT